MKRDGDQTTFGKFSARELTDRFGSPIYIYEAETIRRQGQRLLDTFGDLPLDIHYACKANTNIHIMKLIREMGIKVDCVSPGEVKACLEAGFDHGEMTFTGNNCTVEELTEVHEAGVHCTLDSVDQMERFGQLFAGASVGVRLNHMGSGHHEHVITGGPDSKFGVVQEDYEALHAVIQKYDLKLEGVHQHIGSGIRDVNDWILSMQIMLDSLAHFPGIKWVDFGGGLGVPYAPDEAEIDMDDLRRRVTDIWSAYLKDHPEARDMRLKIQPGRFLVAEAGTLLMTVQSVKRTEKHLFAGTDSGFNHNIRHPLYRAYQPIWNATGDTRSPQTVAVAGNICEAGDLFTHGREMGEVRVGDVLALGKVGAYGFAMSSRYNSRPLPAEVLIDGQEAFLIRRRECYDMLLESQKGLS